MKCKYCKKEIEDDSIFCRFCGEKAVREKRKKKNTDIVVPPPRVLPSGTYFGRVMVKGERINISAASEPEYYLKARAAKQGLIEETKKSPAKTLREAIQSYIDKRTAVLSPSTINGYKAVQRTRFEAYMDIDIHDIDYQAMVNSEAGKISAKTLKNAFALVSAALSEQDIKISVSLPQIAPVEQEWLDFEQIKVFCDAIKGNTQEMGALFALHGLRRSEIYAITPEKIIDGKIKVSGAVVRGPDGMVAKETNKNKTSTREVPIMIPRLQELIDASDAAPGEPYVSCNSNYLWEVINKVCSEAGLPLVGVHGLRRSFASLCFHCGVSELACQKLGGWADYATLHRLYVKLSETDKLSESEKVKDFFA